MFENGFIKNKKLLEENSRLENLIDLSTEIERFSIKIDHIEFSSIVGFIGRFGSGKSNFLNQIKVKYTDDAKWFDFDAWKYPERTNLWENFILDIAEEISKKELEQSARKIEGKNPTIWVEKLTQYCSGLGIGNFSELLKTSPTKRVVELQNIFLNLLLQIEEENVYIIIEDIDRSGDNGTFFLETLNHFLKTNEIEKRIIVIVPIGEENYKKEDIKLSYLKSLDYIHEYSLREIKLDNFVNELFLDEIFNVNYLKGQIITFLEGIFKEFTDQITMRTLKHILRNANYNYIALLKKQGGGVDWRLSIVFETAKYIKNNSGDFYIDIWRKSKKIGSSESIFSALINCIFQENHKINGEKYLDIYKEDFSGNQRIIKPRSFENNFPIKIVPFLYSSLQFKDSILYFADRSERDNRHAGILEDFLD